MDELSYDELMRIYSREKGPSFSAIPQNFYQLSGKLLSSYDKSDPSGMREYSNALKMVKYIYQRRLEKTFNYVLSSSKGIEPPPEMLYKEKALFESLVSAVKANEKETDSEIICFNQSSMVCNVSDKEPIIEERKPVFKLLILKDVDEFVGLDGSVYGPYKQNMEVEIPNQEADILLSTGSAKKIE